MNNQSQFKKYYDRILEEEEKARESIESALNEKYTYIFNKKYYILLL